MSNWHFSRVLWLLSLLALVAEAPAVAQQLKDFPANPAGAAGPAARPGNLSLIIANTEQVQEQVDNLLEQLRSLQGTSTVIEAPFTRAADSFQERIGVNFGFDLPGGETLIGLDPAGNPTPDGSVQFRQGGFNSAVPPFGRPDPGADATFGFRLGGSGGPTFNFNLAAGQGSDRTLTTTTPVVHALDGQTGAVADVSQMPFVTGVIPVVGGAATRLPIPGPVASPPSPLHQAIDGYLGQQRRRGRKVVAEAAAAEKRQAAQPELPREDELTLQMATARGSSAGRGDLSVQAIRRRNAARDSAKQRAAQQETLVLVERARGCELQGKFGAARIYYRQAIKRAGGELRQQLIDKLRAISDR